MLKEGLSVFQKMIEKYSDSIVLDNYVPKDGTYRLVQIQPDDFVVVDTVDVNYDRKSGEILGMSSEYYPLLCYMDYCSKLLEMNKPIDSSKIIHSNNYLSFAVKKDKLIDPKLWEKSIDLYYDTLENPYKKYMKPKAKKIYLQVEEQIGLVDHEVLHRIRKWIKTKEFCKDIDLTKKNYLKVFFLYSDEQRTRKIFDQEGKRYLIPNIYNSNEYNQEIDGNIVGLPSNNMGLNSKKPYIANRTRKVPIPYLLNQENVLLQTKFFDYLMGFASKNKTNIYIDFDRDEIVAKGNDERLDRPIDNGYFLKIRQRKEVEILRGEVISGYSPALKKPFNLIQCLKIDDKYLMNFKPGYGKKTKLFEMEQLIDNVFFEQKLHYNYFTEVADMTNISGELKNLILVCRDRLFSWFNLNQINQHVDGMLKSISLKLVGKSLEENHFILAKHQFNLRWSLMDYFSEEGMVKKMEDVRSMLREHLRSKENWEFETDEEFCYAVGQMAYYLISLSNSKKLPVSFVKPILNAKTQEVTTQGLERLFEKYAYAIDLKDNKYKKAKLLYDHIVRYVLKGKKTSREFILAGTVADCLIYEREEK